MTTSNKPAITSDQEAVFQKMHQELKDYNAAFARREHPTKPNWDPKLYREFRDWQGKRLNQRVQDDHA